VRLPDSISAMRAFVLAAEKRSFKEAGQLVGLTPSAVGKAIQKLEEQLSVQLFHRSTRSITLTDHGQLFLDRCRRILSEVEAAQAELTEAGAEPTGRIKVSIPVEPSLLVPLMTRFSQTFPAIQLDLDINDRFVDVIDEGYDAVVRSGQPSDSRLQARKLGSFDWRFVASPDYLAKHGTPAITSDLASHRCLRHRYPETGRLMPWPVESGGDPKAAIATNTSDSLLNFALSGCGIAYLPAFAVDDLVTAGNLVALLPEHTTIGSLYVLWPASRYPAPKVRAFVDFIASAVATRFAKPNGL